MIQDEATPERKTATKVASLVDDVVVTKEALLTALDHFLDELEKEKRDKGVSLPLQLMQGFRLRLVDRMDQVENMGRWLSKQSCLEGPILLNDAVHSLRQGQVVFRTIMEDYQKIEPVLLSTSYPYSWYILLSFRLSHMLPWLSEKMEIVIRAMLASVQPPLCQGKVCHCGLCPQPMVAMAGTKPCPTRCTSAKRRQGGVLLDDDDEIPCKYMCQLADHGRRGTIYLRSRVGDSPVLH